MRQSAKTWVQMVAALLIVAAQPFQPDAAAQSFSAALNDTPRADNYGDPLPPGALARFGTVRFRHGDQINCAVRGKSQEVGRGLLRPAKHALGCGRRLGSADAIVGRFGDEGSGGLAFADGGNSSC